MPEVRHSSFIITMYIHDYIVASYFADNPLIVYITLLFRKYEYLIYAQNDRFIRLSYLFYKSENNDQIKVIDQRNISIVNRLLSRELKTDEV